MSTVPDEGAGGVDPVRGTLEHLYEALNLCVGRPTYQTNPMFAAALAGVGEVCYRLQHYVESAEAYALALKYMDHFLEKNEEFVTIAENYATVLLAMGKTEEAEKWQRTACDIMTKKLPCKQKNQRLTPPIVRAFSK